MLNWYSKYICQDWYKVSKQKCQNEDFVACELFICMPGVVNVPARSYTEQLMCVPDRTLMNRAVLSLCFIKGIFDLPTTDFVYATVPV